MDTEFIISMFISVGCVIVSISLFYEILRFAWNMLPRLNRFPRLQINMVVLAIFVGHTACVWFYGLFYWLLVDMFSFGTLGGDYQGSFIEAIYFSAATYSSLGFGDVFPMGPLRMISGVEVLNGLLLIGWSVTFTYFAMQKFWNLHSPRMHNIDKEELNKNKLEKELL